MESLEIRHDLRGLDEIHAAIDTNDMAVVVRAATNVLRNNDALPVRLDTLKKCRENSSAARMVGNDHYIAGRYREAVQFYNKAIAFAPSESEEFVLALGNRSAVFFGIKCFSACYHDADAASRAIGCPPDLRIQLENRRDAVLFKCPLELSMNLFTHTNFFCYFMTHNYEKNAEVPCASNNIAFTNRDGTKRVTARNDIKPGTLVAFERAFSSCIVKDTYLCCYFCHKIDLALIPCKRCSQALFCSVRCRDLCWEEYHKIECQELDCLLDSKDEEPENILITRSAIKLSLKLGWDALIEASKDIGTSRMNKATVTQMYNPLEPLSILSYDENTAHLRGNKMLCGSIYCAAILHRLDSVPDYFPEEATVRDAAKDAMARIMLHLYVTFKNTISIMSPVFDINKPRFRSEHQTNYGWFSMSSKLKHSCDPNLLVIGLNDSVGLVALRKIYRQEELTISYIGHFYDHPSDQTGDTLNKWFHGFMDFKQTCDCTACKNNWNENSAINVITSKSQNALLRKLRRRRTINFKCFYSMCNALDYFRVNSVHHKFVYESVKRMLMLMQCKYVQNKTYFPE